MKLQLSTKFIIALVSLVFLMGETHELVHTSVGRLICGCWGSRDFNVWGLCQGCKDSFPTLSVVATLAGPFYSYMLVWIGYFLLHEDRSDKLKAWGLSIIASNILFARILTAAFSGGDEVYGFKKLLESRELAWLIGFILVLLLSVPPLIRVYKTIRNNKKWLWFLGFLILPLIIAMIGAMTLNPLLKTGFLNEVWILGSPLLITTWLVINLVVLLITYKNISLLKE